jgi:hypothetical protein
MDCSGSRQGGRIPSVGSSSRRPSERSQRQKRRRAASSAVWVEVESGPSQSPYLSRRPRDRKPSRSARSAYGIEVVSPAEALSALGGACTLIRRMWAEVEPFDFVGRHYRLKDVVCERKPIQRPGPPILIGSGGEQLGLRVVAEHADSWNCPVRTAEDFRHKSQVLDGPCQAIGRDPAEIERSVQVIVGGDDLLAARRLLVELSWLHPSGPGAAPAALLAGLAAGGGSRPGARRGRGEEVEGSFHVTTGDRRLPGLAGGAKKLQDGGLSHQVPVLNAGNVTPNRPFRWTHVKGNRRRPCLSMSRCASAEFGVPGTATHRSTSLVKPDARNADQTCS